MKPLTVLLGAFVVSLVITKVFRGSFELALSGRIAMAVMLVFTAIGHFAFTKGMSLMIPEFIPFKTEIVYLTGIAEIAFAIGLLLPNYRVITAWSLIIFLILVLPANIWAAIKQLDYQRATFDGNGLAYLWFRIPLQILFIVWTYLLAIYKS
ncbi:DoxX family protein [Sinomicrobium sp.]